MQKLYTFALSCSRVLPLRLESWICSVLTAHTSLEREPREYTRGGPPLRGRSKATCATRAELQLTGIVFNICVVAVGYMDSVNNPDAYVRETCPCGGGQCFTWRG